MKFLVWLLIIIIFSAAAYGAFLFGKKEAQKEVYEQSKITPLVPENETETTPSQPTASNSSGMKDEGGIIEGNLIYPSEVPPPQTVCAEHTETKKLVCTNLTTQVNEKLGYRLTLPPGEYEVYAFLTAEGPTPGPTVHKAYYSEFVTCGLKASCPSHAPIVVKVESGKTVSGVDPQDWYNK